VETHWDLTAQGDFDLILGPLRAPPYNVPEAGLVVPVTFLLTLP
jgi:hypothetical protein